MQPRHISGTDPLLRSPAPESEAEREAIRLELERILASSLFRNSRRCGTFLQYIVNETLEGRGDRLRERTLGTEVFGRAPNYATLDDSIVRTSAAEVRKRLAQYYHEPEHKGELRIELAAGSYVPEFRLVGLATPDSSAEASEALPPVVPNPEPAAGRRRRLGWSLIGLLALALLAAVVYELWSRDPLQTFWAPVWRNAETITVAAGTGGDQSAAVAKSDASPNGSNQLEVFPADAVDFADASTMARVSGLLAKNGKRFEIKRAEAMTLDDLRRGPSVLIGTFNNVWTTRLDGNLRYYVTRDPVSGAPVLLDRQNNSQVLWRSDPAHAKQSEDRAVISRFLDSRTEQQIVLITGFGRDGTSAAAEFVTEPRYMAEFVRRAPKGWTQKNIQIVIGTEIVRGSIGPPHVIAAHVW